MTILDLKRMRTAPRNKILAENPELKAAWEKSLIADATKKAITLEDIRREDAEYMKEGKM